MRKVKSLFLILLMTFILAGCSKGISDTRSLLRPPKISNKFKKIQTYLNENYLDYSIIIPKEGKNKNGIYMLDLDNDTQEESIILLKDNNNYKMKVIILRKDDNDKWIKDKSFNGTGYDINRIDFTDFDGDNNKEIVIGWKGTTLLNNGVSIYTMVNNQFTEVFNKNYTAYCIGNVDGNLDEELLVLRLDKNKGIASATLYDLDLNSKVMYYIDQVKLDAYVNHYYSIKNGKVNENKRGFLIDVSVGAHSSYTDLIIFREGRLENVFYDKKWEYTDITYRAYSRTSKDIDDDGILEIPLLRIPKGYEETSLVEVPFITVWMEWNGLNGLKYDRETYMDVSNNFIITFPNDWRNNVTLNIENNRYFFKYYSIDKKELFDVFELRVCSKEKYYNNKKAYLDYRVLDTKIDKLYLIKFNNLEHNDLIDVDFSFIKNNFKYLN